MKWRDETWFSNEELEAELRRMAEDYHPPGGEAWSVAKLVREHCWWFAAALVRGAKEKALIEMLFEAGITQNGDPISRPSLSRAFNRKQLTKKNAAERLKQELALRPRSASRTARPKQAVDETPHASELQGASKAITKSPAEPVRPPVQATTKVAPIRAYMDRTARFRRKDRD